MSCSPVGQYIELFLYSLYPNILIFLIILALGFVTGYYVNKRYGSDWSDSFFAGVSVALIIIGFILALVGVMIFDCLGTTNLTENISIVENFHIVIQDNSLFEANNTTMTISESKKYYLLNTSSIRENFPPKGNLNNLGYAIGIIGLGLTFLSIGYNNLSNVENRRITEELRLIIIGNSYEARKIKKNLNSREYFVLSIIWISVGLIILAYGFLSASLIFPLVINFIGILILTIGFLILVYIHYKKQTEYSFHDLVERVLTEFKGRK